MAFYTLQPTANQTPDPVSGGLAVISPANTGHASSTSNASGSADYPETFTDTLIRSCRWLSFASVGGSIAAITLKFDWSLSGSLYVNEGTGAGVGDAEADADFNGLYSINNGASFINAVNRSYIRGTNGTTNLSDSGSVNVSIPASTPFSQIIVRDSIEVVVNGDSFGDPVSAGANLSITISNIRLEVETIDQSHLLIMM